MSASTLSPEFNCFAIWLRLLPLLASCAYSAEIAPTSASGRRRERVMAMLHRLPPAAQDAIRASYANESVDSAWTQPMPRVGYQNLPCVGGERQPRVRGPLFQRGAFLGAETDAENPAFLSGFAAASASVTEWFFCLAFHRCNLSELLPQTHQPPPVFHTAGSFQLRL